VSQQLAPDSASTQPLVTDTANTEAIAHYQPKTQITIMIALVLLAVFTIVAGIMLNNLPGPAITETPTPSRLTPTMAPTDQRTGGTGFKDNDVSGYWKIIDTKWSDNTVKITIDIQVDEGILYYNFYAYASESFTQHYPMDGIETDLEPGFAGPGDTVRGEITFELPRQPMTLVLEGQGLRQLSALTVEI